MLYYQKHNNLARDYQQQHTRDWRHRNRSVRLYGRRAHATRKLLPHGFFEALMQIYRPRRANCSQREPADCFLVEFMATPIADLKL